MTTRPQTLMATQFWHIFKLPLCCDLVSGDSHNATGWYLFDQAPIDPLINEKQFAHKELLHYPPRQVTSA